MHQQEVKDQESETTKALTKEQSDKLRLFIMSALNRVDQAHRRRWRGRPAELYKIFINDKARQRLNLPPNLEEGFVYNNRRAILYTSKPEGNISLSYVRCDIIKKGREDGRQTVLYIDAPPVTEDTCIIR